MFDPTTIGFQKVFKEIWNSKNQDFENWKVSDNQSPPPFFAMIKVSVFIFLISVYFYRIPNINQKGRESAGQACDFSLLDRL